MGVPQYYVSISIFTIFVGLRCSWIIFQFIVVSTV